LLFYVGFFNVCSRVELGVGQYEVLLRSSGEPPTAPAGETRLVERGLNGAATGTRVEGRVDGSRRCGAERAPCTLGGMRPTGGSTLLRGRISIGSSWSRRAGLRFGMTPDGKTSYWRLSLGNCSVTVGARWDRVATPRRSSVEARVSRRRVRPVSRVERAGGVLLLVSVCGHCDGRPGRVEFVAWTASDGWRPGWWLASSWGTRTGRPHARRTDTRRTGRLDGCHEKRSEDALHPRAAGDRGWSSGDSRLSAGGEVPRRVAHGSRVDALVEGLLAA